VRICIYGAGAIGGLLGAKLAAAGHEVTLIARGAQLAALRERGLTLRSGEETLTVRPHATDDPAAAGPQDSVILTLKAPGLAAIAGAIGPLLGPETSIVTAMNGILWWYFHGVEGPHRDRRLACIDPDGLLWRALPAERVIGCVVYPAAEVVEPGVIAHQYGNRFMLGEPDGSRSARVTALSRALTEAGFKAPVRPRIRDDIWLKLWGNLSFNPVSALTHGTLDQIAGDPGTHGVIARMMAESRAVGEAHGVSFEVDIETRISWANALVGHRTSMLQDLERGRAMEIDALLGAVVEMGDLAGIDTPLLDAMLALLVQRARIAGCYPAAR
jgi:2-dehydropantoate 2-reductase